MEVTAEQIDFETERNYISNCADKECQVEMCIDAMKPEKTFICIRYISNASYNDVVIHTYITEDSRVLIVPSQKQFKDKKCGTPHKMYADQVVGPDELVNFMAAPTFLGFSSTNKEQQHLDLAGVKFANFRFLLDILSKNPIDYSKISQQDRLFIFLIKIKTGLTFSAISVLFCVHRSTISRIFFEILKKLTAVTANLVF